MAVVEKRLELTVVEDDVEAGRDGSSLVTALCQTPKTLPPRFLYDARGRDLDRRLSELPERDMAKTARAVLKRNADQLARKCGAVDIVEYGAADMAVTRELLDAFRRPGRPQLYVPVADDEAVIRDMAPRLLRQYPDLTIHGVSGGASPVTALPPRQAESRLLVCLDNALGQISSSDSRRFLAAARRALQADDWLLAGLDLEAEVSVLESAYNDPQGMTARLNYNALHHINRLYGGNIDPRLFEHVAFYNFERHQIEMRLVSRRPQVVRIPGLGFQFEMREGDFIVTEFSRKFTLSRARAEFEDNGFDFVDVWADARELHGLFLFRTA